MDFFIYFFAALLCGLIVGGIAQAKHHSFALWFVLGILFVLVALIIILILPAQDAPATGRNSVVHHCPYCGHEFTSNATRCPKCNRSQPDFGTRTNSSWESTVARGDDIEKWAREHPQS